MKIEAAAALERDRHLARTKDTCRSNDFVRDADLARTTVLIRLNEIVDRGTPLLYLEKILLSIKNIPDFKNYFLKN